MTSPSKPRPAAGLRGLLVVAAAVAFVTYLLRPYLGDGRYGVPHHGAAAQTGIRNHSGTEPNDLFGFRPGREFHGGSDLPSEGRD